MITKEIKYRYYAMIFIFVLMSINITVYSCGKEPTVIDISQLTINSIIAFATLSAAYFAWKATDATKKSSLGLLLNDLRREYSSESFLKSIRTLFEWKTGYGDLNNGLFAVYYIRLKTVDNRIFTKLDLCRRQISHFFLNIKMLEERGIIKEGIKDHISLYDELPILFFLIEPMEYALNKNYDKSMFDFFRKRAYLRIHVPINMDEISKYHDENNKKKAAA